MPSTMRTNKKLPAPMHTPNAARRCFADNLDPRAVCGVRGVAAMDCVTDVKPHSGPIGSNAATGVAGVRVTDSAVRVKPRSGLKRCESVGMDTGKGATDSAVKVKPCSGEKRCELAGGTDSVLSVKL